MFHIHILTQPGRIENKSGQIFKVITREQEGNILREGLTIKWHNYNLLCGPEVIEVICPEIQEKGNEDSYLILPEFKIPGRPYPIYVYIYAAWLYSTNPVMGQREAAEKTQERFGLETFSHTTVGRAMIALENIISKNDRGTEKKEDAAVDPEGAGAAFPSVEQTKKRREIVASYLKKACEGGVTIAREDNRPRNGRCYWRIPYIGAFIDACHSIAGYTFLKYHRFLL